MQDVKDELIDIKNPSTIEDIKSLVRLSGVFKILNVRRKDIGESFTESLVTKLVSLGYLEEKELGLNPLDSTQGLSENEVLTMLAVAENLGEEYKFYSLLYLLKRRIKAKELDYSTFVSNLVEDLHRIGFVSGEELDDLEKDVNGLLEEMSGVTNVKEFTSKFKAFFSSKREL